MPDLSVYEPSRAPAARALSVKYVLTYPAGGLCCTLDLPLVLAAVRAAGGWRAYCDAQFRDLRRELLAPGAVAKSSERVYERVFVELPNAVFPRVLAFRPPAF